MKHVVSRRRKGRAVPRRHRRHKATSLMNAREMDEHFYMYSSEDLPEIESDLFENDIKPEISRDYYL